MPSGAIWTRTARAGSSGTAAPSRKTTAQNESSDNRRSRCGAECEELWSADSNGKGPCLEDLSRVGACLLLGCGLRNRTVGSGLMGPDERLALTRKNSLSLGVAARSASGVAIHLIGERELVKGLDRSETVATHLQQDRIRSAQGFWCPVSPRVSPCSRPEPPLARA